MTRSLRQRARLGTIPRLSLRASFGVAILLCCGLWPAPASSQDRLPIIDMHMHARTEMARDAVGKPLPFGCEPQPCERVPAAAVTDGDVLRLTLEAMDRHNIVLGFLSDPVERVYEWVEAAPDRFIASPAIGDPNAVDLGLLRQEYEAGRLKGMGELVNQYAGIPANDPRMEPVFALAHEMDVPVLIHHGGLAAPSPDFRLSHGRPELLEEVLLKFPELRLYLENAAFPFLDDAIALMYRHPNVYADLSTITWLIPREAFHNYLRGLVDAGLVKRLMWGSDQMSWPEAIDHGIEAVESADFLTEEQKRDIFYNNAARFLRLSEEEIAKHHGRN